MADEQAYLKIDGVSKRFGVVQALKDVSFDVRKGEIHTILGENGAGKSTLVKVIRGEHRPDSGRLWLDGREVERFDPLYAHDLGIAMVHQELAVFENMTVAENIFPAREFRTRFGFVDERRMVERAREALAWFGADIDPKARMADLSLAEQQIVEILRATSLEKKVIILDEPTSGLKAREADALIERLQQLKAQGITILFISHRIPEILRVSDRVTILRDGEYIATLENRDLGEHELVTRMVGRELEALYAQKVGHEGVSADPFLQGQGLTRRRRIEDVSFVLHRSEILGVFGLEGSGTHELSRALFGLDGLDSGQVVVKGETLKRVTPAALLKRKVVYLYNNRKEAGLFLGMSACDNMAVLALKRLSRFGLMRRRAAREYTDRYAGKFSIVMAGVHSKPSELSGGNQQKLMLGTCLGTDPECVIINEPTRGIDVGAKAEIHKVIGELAQAGTSVMVFSSELPELISLCDRILVMSDRRLAGEFQGEAMTEETLMAAAVGRLARAGESNG